MTFCSINDPQKMRLIDFEDLLTFPLAPPANESFYLFSEISQHLLDENNIWFRHSWSAEDESKEVW